MNHLAHLIDQIHTSIQQTYGIDDATIATLQTALNTDKDASFGDISSNAPLVLAKAVKTNPRMLAQEIVAKITGDDTYATSIAKIDIAGPGFLNIFLTNEYWQGIYQTLYTNHESFFKPTAIDHKKRYLIEIVSANPTGPLHLGHGRGGIIGDVLGKILSFIGHEVDLEYYINDAGSQMLKLGASIKVRCEQVLGGKAAIPEGGYSGEYLLDIAKQCVEEYGQDLRTKDDTFFITYAKDALLANIRHTLSTYRIEYDRWFSEKTLHESGAIDTAIQALLEAGMAYEQDGALWFASKKFGDDKDRVIRKADGSLTYIAADIAYHQDKFERGYDELINVFGQDHHGYVKRLKATMEALGYDQEKLQVILYQLVTIKRGEQALRMSKRKGTFTCLDDVIDEVGVDVARFFYLNRKAEAHLEFDLEQALSQSEENPAYYLQYAYVRTKSLLAKAQQELGISRPEMNSNSMGCLDIDEISVLKKVASLHTLLNGIASNHQTHLLAYYSVELARTFHSYYARNRIVDADHATQTAMRLGITVIMRDTLALCLRLLGLSLPEKM